MSRGRTWRMIPCCVLATPKWPLITRAKAKRAHGARDWWQTPMVRMVKSNFPKRGEVWWVCFDPSIGAEMKKTRSAIVMSNDSANEFLERIQVVSLTSNTARVYPSEALVTVQGKKSKAAADQVATVSKMRVYKKIGNLNARDLAEVEYVLKIQLGL